MGDLISRKMALDAFGLSEKSRKFGGDHSGYETRMLYEIQDVLEDLPDAEPEKKIGKWIKRKFGLFDWDFQCNQCGKYLNLMGLYGKRHLNYCPNCGARMEMPEDD